MPGDTGPAGSRTRDQARRTGVAETDVTLIAELQKCGTQADVERVRAAHQSLFAGFAPPADGSGKMGRKSATYVKALVNAAVEWVNTHSLAARLAAVESAATAMASVEGGKPWRDATNNAFADMVALIRTLVGENAALRQALQGGAPEIAAVKVAVEKLQQQHEAQAQAQQPPAQPSQGSGTWAEVVSRKHKKALLAEVAEQMREAREREDKKLDLVLKVGSGRAPPPAESRQRLEGLLQEGVQLSASAAQAIMAKVTKVVVHSNKQGPGYVLLVTFADMEAKLAVHRRRHAWRDADAAAAAPGDRAPAVRISHNLTPRQRAEHDGLFQLQQRLHQQGVPVRPVFHPTVGLVVAGSRCDDEEQANTAAAIYLRRACPGRGAQPGPGSEAGPRPAPSRGQRPAQAPAANTRADRQRGPPPPPPQAPPAAVAAAAAMPAAPAAGTAAAARSAELPALPAPAATATTTAAAPAAAAPTAAAGAPAADAPTAAAAAMAAGAGSPGGAAAATAATAAGADPR